MAIEHYKANPKLQTSLTIRSYSLSLGIVLLVYLLDLIFPNIIKYNNLTFSLVYMAIVIFLSFFFRHRLDEIVINSEDRTALLFFKARPFKSYTKSFYPDTHRIEPSYKKNNPEEIEVLVFFRGKYDILSLVPVNNGFTAGQLKEIVDSAEKIGLVKQTQIALAN